MDRPNFLHWNAHIFLFGLILRDIPNFITPQTTLRLLPFPVGLLILPCTRRCRRFPLTSSPFFVLSRTEEPAKADTCARDRRALQQLALNVHVRHSDLTWPPHIYIRPRRATNRRAIWITEESRDGILSSDLNIICSPTKYEYLRCWNFCSYFAKVLCFKNCKLLGAGWYRIPSTVVQLKRLTWFNIKICSLKCI